jgi:hypothetical protein
VIFTSGKTAILLSQFDRPILSFSLNPIFEQKWGIPTTIVSHINTPLKKNMECGGFVHLGVSLWGPFFLGIAGVNQLPTSPDEKVSW